MARLLIVHHTSSPSMQAMLEAVLAGAGHYPCLEATQRRHYGLYVHGNNDTGGAVRAVESITTGLRWRRARPPVTVVGDVGPADLEACRELGATVAAELAS